MIAIVAALPGELSAIEAAASAEGPLTTRRVAGRDLRGGTLCGRPVLLALSGVGKVAAASTATLLVEQASAVILVGTAGGIGTGVEPGDVVVAAELVQHDLDAPSAVGPLGGALARPFAHPGGQGPHRGRSPRPPRS